MNSRRRVRLGAGAVMLLLITCPVSAFEVELLGSIPVNVTSELEIEQDGVRTKYPGTSFRSQPTTTPILWALRFSHPHDDGRWSIEFFHHKLYLKSPPPDIGRFGISHGFNQLTVQRTWERLDFRLSAGMGPVFAHPENVVRGRTLDEKTGILDTGYHLTGPAIMVGASRRWAVTHGFGVVTEVRNVLVPVDVPVAGGVAKFRANTVHFMIGISALR